MLENLDDDNEMKHGWLIKTRTKSFVVFAATQSEKNEWMLHIQRCIEVILNDGKTPSKSFAAVWIPDGEALKCMCCQTSHFSVVNRRHHCRACGIVVCNACSSKSFILEGISKKAVRVCDTCYNKLCQGMSIKRSDAVFGANSPNTSDEINDSSDYSEGEETSNSYDVAPDSNTPTFYESTTDNGVTRRTKESENVEKLI